MNCGADSMLGAVAPDQNPFRFHPNSMRAVISEEDLRVGENRTSYSWPVGEAFHFSISDCLAVSLTLN